MNTSPHEQNDWHFTDNIFKCILMNVKFCILLQISLKFVPKGPVDSKPVLVQEMARHWTGKKPLSEPVYWWIYAALGENKLIHWSMNKIVHILHTIYLFSWKDWNMLNFVLNKWHLTHRGPVDLRKWTIFNTILMSPKSWLSQEDLDVGCEHSMVPMDS